MSTEAESTPETPSKSRAPLIFGVVIAAVLLFMGGWFIGYRAVTQMEATLATERAAFAEELEAARAEATAATAAQAHAEANAMMLAARQGLAQADDAIAAENFGLAREHLARTRSQLASGGVTFAPFADQAATLEILSGGDTSETRAQIRALATSLDEAIAETFGAPSATE